MWMFVIILIFVIFLELIWFRDTWKIKSMFCHKRCQRGRLLKQTLFALNIFIGNLYGKYIFNCVLRVFVYLILILKYLYGLIPKISMSIVFIRNLLIKNFGNFKNLIGKVLGNFYLWFYLIPNLFLSCNCEGFVLD